MSDSNKTLHKLTKTLSNAEPLDPGLATMDSEARVALISAGDEIEEVLTHTLTALANNPEVQIRDLDIARVTHDIARLTFWENVAAQMINFAKIIRDQELILEDRLQRDAHHISKELKHYTQDNSTLATEFNKLDTYIQRAVTSRKRNRAILDKIATDEPNKK